MSDLLERDELLAALALLAEGARVGRGRAVLVGGEAGIGKSSLLERFAAHLQHGRILWGGCEALTTPRPLGPLHDIAAQTQGGLAARLAGGTDRAALFAAVLAEFASPAMPTIMIFEDVHWADEATLDLVKFLGRRIHQAHGLVVLSHRDDLVSLGKLRTLFGELPSSHVTRLVVPPLSRAAVDRLTEDRPRLDAAGIHAATGGNAFFVAEILRQGGEGTAVPVTVRDAVLARVASLAEPALQVLHLVAIVPRQADIDLVDQVLAPETDAVEACLASGLLVTEGRSLRFRHELARSAVEAAIPPLRAARLHGQVLAALGGRPEGTVSLALRAHHAQGAGDVEAVLRWAPQAAREAALRGARREAAAQCRAALAHADRMADADRADLLDTLASHCFELNELPAAIAAREEAIALHERAGDVERQSAALSAQAMSLVRALRNAEADAASRRAIGLAETLPRGRALACAYATESYLRMLNRDNEEAIATGEQAVELADLAGDVVTSARAGLSVGAALMFVDYARGAAHVARSLERARRLEDGGAGVADACLMLGTASGELHQFHAAGGYLTEGIAFSHAHDLDRLAGYMESWQALCDLYQGRWTLAGHRANAAFERQAAGTTNRVVALVALGRLRTRRGDPGAAPVLAEALELAARSGTLQRLGPVCAARAEAAWIDGDDDGARREAARAIDLAAQKRHPWLLGELAFWQWRADTWPTTSPRGESAAPPPPPGCAEPFRLQMAGQWREAAAAWQAMGCPYEEARALADGDEAAQRSALAILDGLGAKPLAERIRRALRHAGVRAVPRGALARTRAHEAGLTTREIEVLGLLADGWRNAEIAERLSRSARTVEHHVEAILAKLEVGSRHDAVEAARRRGLIPKNG